VFVVVEYNCSFSGVPLTDAFVAPWASSIFLPLTPFSLLPPFPLPPFPSSPPPPAPFPFPPALLQLNIRKLLEDAALPPINIICQKVGGEGLTRFEDRHRLPLGISVNLNSYAAKLLTQVWVRVWVCGGWGLVYG
jgi:hypothetical protein